jgi:hypothetical protein
MAERVLRRRRRADGPETLETSDFATNPEAPQLFAILDDLTARRGVRLCRGGRDLRIGGEIGGLQIFRAVGAAAAAQHARGHCYKVFLCFIFCDVYSRILSKCRKLFLVQISN